MFKKVHKKVIESLTYLSLDSSSKWFILSGRVRGIRVLLILVIHGC